MISLSLFFNISCNNNYKITFCDFREANVSVKSVDFLSVFWRPPGYYLSRFPLNPALAHRKYLPKQIED
jgi:hypothetical protein